LPSVPFSPTPADNSASPPAWRARSTCAAGTWWRFFARLARPIDFASIDERPVDLVVLLLTPADGGNRHLATLAALARPLRDDGFVRQLRQAQDAAALHRLLLAT